jgi:photosystem II stability/assembly factor-like uncharacterized protein
MAAEAPAGDFYAFAGATGALDVTYAGSHMSGLFRSTDGGGTWARSQLETTHVGGQIAIDPSNPTHAITTTGQLFRTVDGGGHWQATGVGSESGGSGQYRGVLYHGGALLLVDGDGTLFRSTDNGDSVERVASIPGAAGAPPPHLDEDRFFIDERWWSLGSSGDTLWALQHEGALHRSVDQGQTWAVADEGPFSLMSFGADATGAWAGGFDRIVLASAADTQVLDARGLDVVAMARTLSGSLVWSDGVEVLRRTADGSVQVVEMAEEVHEIRAAFAHPDGTVLLGDQDGVYASADDGASFARSEQGLLVDDLGPMLTHPDCPSWVWTGTVCERGLFFDGDWGSEALTRVDVYFHYVMVGRVSPAAPSDIWFSTDDRVMLSQDAGLTWERLAPEVLDVHLHGLDVHPTEPGTALVGSVGSGESSDATAKVYRTTDHGETWSDSSAGLPQSESSVHALHYVRTDPQVVLLGSFPGGDFTHSTGDPGFGVYRSTDGGGSWAEVSAQGAADVAVFAECGGRVFAATDVGVLTSDDAGATWSVALEGGLAFRSVACDGDVVVAIDQGELWRSDDAGGSWRSWGEGLDMSRVLDVALSQVGFSGDGAVVYAAVPGIGLLRRPR